MNMTRTQGQILMELSGAEARTIARGLDTLGTPAATALLLNLKAMLGDCLEATQQTPARPRAKGSEYAIRFFGGVTHG